jgi:hypothetical protein
MEPGWRGSPSKTILRGFNNLLTHEGCNWDYKLDYWVNKPISVAEDMDVNQCIKIWTEAKNIRFTRSPLDIIETSGNLGKIKHNLQQLNLTQVSELEKRFKLPLLSAWQTQRQEQVIIDGLLFIFKDGRYYVERPTGLEELTNFALEFEKVVRKGDQFFRQGIVHYEGREIPLELNNHVFIDGNTFLRALTWYFLNNGIGVPIVSVNYRRYVLDVVNRLNAKALTQVCTEGLLEKAEPHS